MAMNRLVKLLSIVLVLLVLIPSTVAAQTADAGVYYLFVRIDETLIDSRKVETTSNRKVMTGYSERVEVPAELLDTVRSVTAQLVKEKLGVETDMLYLKDKKGRNRATQSMNIFPGMPFANLGPVRKVDNRKFYVKIYVDIAPQGKVSANLDPSRSKQRPKVDMRVDVFDNEGGKHFSNRVVLRDFDVLRSKSRVRGRVKVTNSEVLSAEDIIEMYFLALESALFN
jgi:hypothetical protein